VKPLSSAAAPGAIYAVLAATDAAGILAQEPECTEGAARAGTDIARVVGLDATGVALSGSALVWATVVDRVEATNPRLALVGIRGLTVRSALVGSVSYDVASHANPGAPRPLRRPGDTS
jgi:hypothetical protein